MARPWLTKRGFSEVGEDVEISAIEKFKLPYINVFFVINLCDKFGLNLISIRVLAISSRQIIRIMPPALCASK